MRQTTKTPISDLACQVVDPHGKHGNTLYVTDPRGSARAQMERLEQVQRSTKRTIGYNGVHVFDQGDGCFTVSGDTIPALTYAPASWSTTPIEISNKRVDKTAFAQVQ